MSTPPEFTSVYIPRVSKDWNEDSMRTFFWQMGIGQVERVDFFEDPQVDGASGAFVHLTRWACTFYAKRLYLHLLNGGQRKVYIPGTDHRYFIMKKMIAKRIPDTRLNIHQLVERIIELENSLASHRAEWLAEKARTKKQPVEELEDGQIVETKREGFIEDILSRKRINYDDAISCDSYDDEPLKRATLENHGDKEAVPTVERIRNTAELCGNN
jgi:hypothetical protein